MAADYHLYVGLRRHTTLRCTRDQGLTSLVCLVNVVEVEDFRVPIQQLLAQRRHKSEKKKKKKKVCSKHTS
jgi:hypothetical protein